ncbi:TIGR03086 family metal-binding protein [Frankia sp. ACN1ag]|uniref:TIGR03086 family metal-binding protein n=1 Tax=Frankia sp. ACN1ag TaxID=102891 RepID=UPI0006DCE161|nr:TIGR03086 family metal-binding protein [Frankia sp. ACN1ag]
MPLPPRSTSSNVRQAIEVFDERLVAADLAALAHPSPCDGWTGADVVAHVARNLAGLSDALRGGDYRVATAQPGLDPRRTWVSAQERALADLETFDVRGVPDMRVRIGQNTVTAEYLLVALVRDVTIHAWDLARAVGGDDRLPADLVEAVLADMPAISEEMRGPGRYGSVVPTPQDAGAQERMLALAGRMVR